MWLHKLNGQDRKQKETGKLETLLAAQWAAAHYLNYASVLKTFGSGMNITRLNFALRLSILRQHRVQVILSKKIWTNYKRAELMSPKRMARMKPEITLLLRLRQSNAFTNMPSVGSSYGTSYSKLCAACITSWQSLCTCKWKRILVMPNEDRTPTIKEAAGGKEKRSIR